MITIDASPPAIASLFVPGSFTVATLPSASAFVRMYAWASDLFGGPGDYVISDGTNWKPVRPLAFTWVPANNATLTTLLSAPTQMVNGTIAVGVTVTFSLSTTYAYPGARFRVTRKTTGAGGLVVGTTGISMNSWVDMEFDGSVWVQTGSGGLL